MADTDDIRFGLLDRAAGDDPDLVVALARLVNEVYVVAEAGLWAGSVPRTSPAEVRGLVASGEVVAAHRSGVVVGVVRVHHLGAEVGEFGMLAAAPTHRGLGVGRGLIDFAEDLGRGRAWRAMRLELLVPRVGTHPTKEFLRSWYQRCGYVVVGGRPAEQAYPDLAPLLAVPCDFLVFEKPLDPR